MTKMVSSYASLPRLFFTMKTMCNINYLYIYVYNCRWYFVVSSVNGPFFFFLVGWNGPLLQCSWGPEPPSDNLPGFVGTAV